MHALCGKRHIDVLGILDYGNPIYNINGYCPNNENSCLPPNIDDFVRFAKTTIEHFNPLGVKSWEVWNEPNNGTSPFWRECTCKQGPAPQPPFCTCPFTNDPALFGDMTLRVAKALAPRSGITVAPGGTIYQWEITNAAGGGQSGPDFMTSCFAAQPSLGPAIDVEAIHTYEAYPPRHAPEESGSVAYVNDLLRATEISLEDKITRMNGVYNVGGFHGKPTWITETGWPTKNGVTEEKQARWLLRSLMISALYNVERVYLYFMYDEAPPTDGLDGAAYAESWFGLKHLDTTPKKSYLALQAFFHDVGDFAVTRRVPQTSDPGAWVIELHDTSSRRGWVAWKQDEQGIHDPPPSPYLGWHAPAAATRYDMIDTVGQAVNAGDVIALGPNPVYVVENLAPQPPPNNDPLVACNRAGDPQASYAARSTLSLPAVTSYCDTPSGLGEYQCDQFANRFVSTLNLPPVDNWVQNLACEICDLVASDPTLSRYYSVWGPGYRNTSGAQPQPNDLLVWSETSGCTSLNPGSPGHVAVVTASDAGAITYIQQNWTVGASVNGSLYSAIPIAHTAWNLGTHFFGAPGGNGGNNYVPKCWVHPELQPGSAGNPGPGHNPCAGVSHANNGLYCGLSNQTASGFNRAIADQKTVYECFDGQIANEEHCRTNCFVAPPGHPDGCGDPCSGVTEDGFYCGRTNLLGFRPGVAQPDWLYHCVNQVAVPDLIENCGNRGCDINLAGPDHCTAHPADDPCADVKVQDDGPYCASSRQFHFADKTTPLPALRYTCQGGVTVRTAVCGSCIPSVGAPDYCDLASDPCENVPSSENGTYCAGATNQWGFDPKKAPIDGLLYTCVDGHTIQSSACLNGCYFNPTGPDGCNP